MRYPLLFSALLLSGLLSAQFAASPNGRYYENLPHGELRRGESFALYVPAGADSIRALLVFPDTAALDPAGTAYAPWILDNLIAQGSIPAVAAVFPLTAPASTPYDYLLEVRQWVPGVSAGAAVHGINSSSRTVELVSEIRDRVGQSSLGRVSAGAYAFPEAGGSPTLLGGTTAHFTDLQLERWDLDKSQGDRQLSEPDREQMLIVKEGGLTVSLRDTTYRLGPRSVLFVAAGESATVRSPTGRTTAYRMHYAGPPAVVPASGASFVVDYEQLEFHPHDKGGLRDYFRRSTPFCPYYEMHMTTLNPGIKSHEPHVHAAAEAIIVVEGSTEMEIGDEVVRARAGEVYYTTSQVPHAIRNVGDAPCTYFAFQWDN